MKITDEKWKEIIVETRAGIARWIASKGDGFVCGVYRGTNYEILFTHHPSSKQRKMVARELATGKLRAATSAKHGKGVSIKTLNPKGWLGLANKPAAEIVRKLKLLNFRILDSNAPHANSGRGRVQGRPVRELPDLKTLKRAMVNAHPDREPSSLRIKNIWRRSRHREV